MRCADRRRHHGPLITDRLTRQGLDVVAGTFDASSDGLPPIGPVPGAKGIFAAYGYGGNGITFSFLAAPLIGGLIAGSTSPLLQDSRWTGTADRPLIDGHKREKTLKSGVEGKNFQIRGRSAPV